MPELPEVEMVVRGIRPLLTARTICDAWLDWEKSLVYSHPGDFAARLANQKVQDVQRRAKYIVIRLDADWLMIHLKMTGRLYVVPDDTQTEADRWVHFFFQLDNEHQLRFSDARKFGRVYLTDEPDSVLGHLGPEPLEDGFTAALFAERLRGRKGKIKPLLLNQAFIAGIGNIYADEALHRAHIHPTRAADTLGEQEIAGLYEAVRWVLLKGIERQGASINWYRNPNGEKGQMQDEFFAYGRQGQLCHSCEKQVIEKIIVGQRGTHYCPYCQR